MKFDCKNYEVQAKRLEEMLYLKSSEGFSELGNSPVSSHCQLNPLC